MNNFGKLKKVELREYWKDEAKDFTPWLAKEENLVQLGDDIKIGGLELIGTEISVGDFKVDILAKDTDEQYVVIENQLEKTNHDHLGKLLTYAAGHSAKTVIWIAEELKEEHRKALDWLNEKTVEGIEFFGLEVELWQIGDSQPAPKFNVVSQPNDWAKRVVQSDNSELTELKILQQEFWKGLTEYMKLNKTFLNLRKARAQHWYTLAVGSPKFHISLTVNSRLKQIGCELYIRETQYGFTNLEKDREAIEKELNSKLEWQELPEKKASRIIQYHPADFQNKDNWEELFKWFKERAESFHNTFHNRIKNLDLTRKVA